MNKNKILDWAAWSVVALTVGGITLSMGMNWQFTTFFLIPLVAMVVGIGWTIGWACARCYRLLGALDRSEAASGLGNITKVAMIVAAMLMLVSSSAKAIDDNMAGAWQGIYSHMSPTITMYWSNFLGQFNYAWHANDRHSNYDGR